jgi:hypothetical protein
LEWLGDADVANGDAGDGGSVEIRRSGEKLGENGENPESLGIRADGS